MGSKDLKVDAKDLVLRGGFEQLECKKEGDSESTSGHLASGRRRNHFFIGLGGGE